MFSQIEKPLIMGILNITPDSFSDGGQYHQLDGAIARCREMLAQGADIIDIGGESTRPGSDPVSAEQQLERVVPVIEAIRREISETVPISIDTTLSLVARGALDAGATLINDVSAGLDDDEILALAASRNSPIILMHRQGTPKTMQDNPYYDDAVLDILDEINSRVEAALDAGIAAHHIAIDPGIGFGKRKQDNLELLANLDQFVATGFAVMLGASRKRFMGSICQLNNPLELVTATAVTTALGVMAGVKLFRVHDIKENRQALDVAWAVKQAG